MTESTGTRGFEDVVKAYAEEAMGKGHPGHGSILHFSLYDNKNSWLDIEKTAIQN